MKRIIRKAMLKLPYLKQQVEKYGLLQAEVVRMTAEMEQYRMGWPPGHFYSPLPSLKYIQQRESKIWGDLPRELPGIDLYEQEQLMLLNQLSGYYHLQPWKHEKQEHLRYFFNNPNYSCGESILLFCLMMHIKPRAIVEVGSGYSSCALLDINTLFFNSAIKHALVEPYP